MNLILPAFSLFNLTNVKTFGNQICKFQNHISQFCLRHSQNKQTKAFDLSYTLFNFYLEVCGQE